LATSPHGELIRWSYLPIIPWRDGKGCVPNIQEEEDMASAKEQMIRVIQEQPDDSSYEEVLRELAFARMVDRGLADSRAGRTISDDEMKRRIKTRRS